MSLEDFRGVCGTNIQSAWVGLKYTIPAMRMNGGGGFVCVHRLVDHIGNGRIVPKRKYRVRNIRVRRHRR